MSMVSENNTQKVTLIEKAETENTRTETYLQIHAGCGGEMGRRGRLRQKDQELKVFFVHVASSRPAWTTVVGFKNPTQTEPNQIRNICKVSDRKGHGY